MHGRKIALVICLLSLAPLLGARDFAAGIILGEPTGLSFAINQSQAKFWDFCIAYSLAEDDRLHFHFDRLWSSPLSNAGGARIRVYYGIGGRLITHDERGDGDRLRLGARAPLGLSFRFRRSRLELFLEGALIMDVVPSTDIDFNAGVGLRYHF